MKKDKPLGEVEVTERGFEIVEFTDQYGEKCSLQQSSAMGDDDEAPGAYHIWLGCENNCFHDVTREPLSPRMHLNREQAFQLMILLLKWIHHGSFK